MSGTSLDGLDLALCRFKGTGTRTRVELMRFATLPYEGRFREEVWRVFAKKEVDFQHLVLLNVIVAEEHARLVNQCLRAWGVAPSEVDLLASHGQTVFHAPKVFHGLPDYPNATLQIGDGDHLARRTGIITVSDFRQKHVAAGGEGAPLALYGDYLLFSKKEEERFLLNLGGIANFTYLPASGDKSLAFATDTGPGNTLLDSFARELFGVPFDEGARIASKGRADEYLLAELLREPFFSKPFPKTIGPELFSPAWAKGAMARMPKGRLNPYDLMATLSQLTAVSVSDAIKRVPLGAKGKKPKLYLSGGGAHNTLIVNSLRKKLPEFSFYPMSILGIDGDAKEAVLFAVLANETVAGANDPDSVLGGIPWVGMGKISFPD
jgi:anhydro-N-acetylmuramic acid kinase